MQLVPLLFLLAFASAPATLDTKPVAPAKKAAAEKTAPVAAIQKIGVVGASMAAGFGLDPKANPFMGQASSVQLAQIIDASVLVEHAPPVNHADFMFFTAPESTAKRQLKKIEEAKCSAVVAIDLLFWLGYGQQSDADRMKELEAGLTALEAFKVPVLVGDLPDFADADVDPMMLDKAAIPSREALDKMNARIGAWAKAKKNVVVVPIADALAKLLADEELVFGPNKYPKGSRGGLLMPDHLHTTLEGTCAVWALAVDAWSKADPALQPSLFEIDAKKLAEKVRAAAEKNVAPAPAGGSKKKAK